MGYIKPNLSALSCLWAVLGICHGVGVVLDTPNKEVGDSVTFTTTINPPDNTFLVVSWKVNGSKIITSTTTDVIAPAYKDRVTLDGSTGSLELRNLSLSDSGLYSLEITPSEGGNDLVGETTLTVYEPVSNVSLAASETDLVEFSGSVVLSCSSSGSSLSYHWLNGSSEVTASDAVQIGDGGSTLTIVNVTRYNQGPFRCNVSNAVSHNISTHLYLTITYGPENIVLKVNPSDVDYGEGSDIVLFCSADSRPPATFQWVFNGALSLIQGPELRLDHIKPEQAGNYSCVANNSKTLNLKTSERVVINVLEKVSSGVIHPNDPDILEGHSTNLTCDAAGSISTREWTKDGQPLSPNDRITFSEENRTLFINTTKRTDKGKYLCTVKNPFSSVLAETNIKIIYGPDDVKIEGVPQVGMGATLSLMCSADLYPTATHTWMLNGTEIPIITSVFTKENAESSDSGYYICRAKNDVTGNETASEPFLVTVVLESMEPTPGLSAGAIAGIVVGILVLVSLVILLIWFMVKKKRIPLSKNTLMNRFSNAPANGNTSRSTDNRAGVSNGAGSGDQEVNYADLSNFRRKDGVSVQLSNTAPPSEVNNQPPGRSNAGRPSSPPPYLTHLQQGHAKGPAPRPTQGPNTIYADVRPR